MSSKFYEQSEHYVREYEMKNGLGREMVEQEQRTRGTPFQTSFDRDSRFDAKRDFPDSPLGRTSWESKSGPRIVPTTFPSTFSATPIVADRRTNPHTFSARRDPYAADAYATTQPYASTRIPATNAYHTTNYYCYHPPYASADTYGKHPPTAPYGYYASHDIHGAQGNGTPTEFSPHHTYQNSTTPSDPNRSSRGPSAGADAKQKLSSRPGSPQNIAGAGDIVNTENGFTIQLDIKHFNAKDIKVTLSGNTLIVTGERVEEDANADQTLKRSFSRKYAIPDDIKLESVKSYITDNGYLVIRGTRKTWKETEISVQVEEPARKVEEPTRPDKTSNLGSPSSGSETKNSS
jgi:HSP20 family molecular chaperone IbpA